MPASPQAGSAVLLLAFLLACAGPATPRVSPAIRTPGPSSTEIPSAGLRAARMAVSMIGVPYRYGGSSPRGFDCSGLVVYSYAKAGIPGLPHSAADLERRARPIALGKLEPGDLLFFHLGGRKATHVGIYVGERAFVHAPSSGRVVEKVGFEDRYWGPRIQRAGRLEL